MTVEHEPQHLAESMRTNNEGSVAGFTIPFDRVIGGAEEAVTASLADA